MKVVGLLGENINYSKSPELHNTYYKENNIDLFYKLFDVKKQDLPYFMDGISNNIIGFNITIPYKESIKEYLYKLEYPANKIGAVNTVINNEGALIGYNTDYFGFIKSLEINKINVKHKNILILGSGGAAKAVYYALKDLRVKEIDIACRNLEKCKINFKYVNNIYDINRINDISNYYMVVNATPLGNVKNNIMPIKIKEYKKDTIFYDLNYIPKKSLFLEKGQELGFKIINGEEMLYYQAMKAINLWKEII